jgi:glucokinase
VHATSGQEAWNIGVDVGGTKIAAGAVDIMTGTVSHQRQAPTRPERGFQSVLETIAGLVETTAGGLASDGRGVSAIGVAVPELVDAAGCIRSHSLLDWDGDALVARLKTIAPAVVASDVRCAAQAEATFGAGRPYRLFAYVTIGTGISSALVQDGTPLVGARGGAMVLTSGSLAFPCPGCGAANDFVLEEYASGPALARRYFEATAQEARDAETVTAAANAGDPVAREIVDSATAALGSAIGWLVNVLDPEAVVVGGGIGLSGGRYWDCLVQNSRMHIWNCDARDLPIIAAGLGPDSGVIGAAEAAQK